MRGFWAVKLAFQRFYAEWYLAEWYLKVKKANMKTYIAIILLFALQACEKEFNQPATIIRDCSGTYLRFEGKDYQVCNTEKTDSFNNEATVIATFKRVNNCRNPKSETVCFLLHANEGLVEIQKIK